MATKHIFSDKYILANRVTSIDNPTAFSTALFTRKYIYAVVMLPVMDDKPVMVNGKTGFEHFTDLMNSESDEAAIHSKASLIVSNFEGACIDVTQLKNLVVKTSFFSKGIYMRENIDTFKKFNRCITGGGKELYVKLTDFYKDFKPLNW